MFCELPRIILTDHCFNYIQGSDTSDSLSVLSDRHTHHYLPVFEMHTIDTVCKPLQVTRRESNVARYFQPITLFSFNQYPQGQCHS